MRVLGSLPILVTLLAAFAISVCCGCGGKDVMKSVYSTNIKKLHGSYTLYLQEHSFEGPENEEEFKNYLKTDPTAIHLLKRIDVTPETVDEMFIGDRDGEPFVIRYGLDGVADHAIVFEAVGVEGKRLVALADPIEVENDEYNDYLSGAIEPEREGGTGISEDDVE